MRTKDIEDRLDNIQAELYKIREIQRDLSAEQQRNKRTLAALIEYLDIEVNHEPERYYFVKREMDDNPTP